MARKELKKTAGEMAETAKERGTEAMRAVGDQTAETARRTGQALKDAATSRAEAGKDAIADEGEAFATRLRDRAGAGEGTLRDRLMGVVADSVSEASDELRRQSIGSLLARTEAFARQHPGAFVAGAAIAGFAVARFAQASARPRRDDHGDDFGGDFGGGRFDTTRAGGQETAGTASPQQEPPVTVAGHPDAPHPAPAEGRERP